jgi:hypothetical protein
MPATAAWSSTSTTAAPFGGARRRATRPRALRAAPEPKNRQGLGDPEAFRVPRRIRFIVAITSLRVYSQRWARQANRKGAQRRHGGTSAKQDRAGGLIQASQVARRYPDTDTRDLDRRLRH